jgi:hypothetical protein
MLRVLGLPRAQRVGGAGVGERAAGVLVGQDDRLLRVEDLRGLRHEMDAAEEDQLGIALGLRGAREVERVPEVVGEVLDLGVLVVVREDHRTARTLEPIDLGEEIEGGVDRGRVHPGGVRIPRHCGRGIFGRGCARAKGRVELNSRGRCGVCGGDRRDRAGTRDRMPRAPAGPRSNGTPRDGRSCG